VSHLDARRWRQLLAGQLPETEATALRAHLGQGCDLCEQLIAELAAQGEVDALDGVADDALLELGEVQAAPVLDEVGFARVQRSLRRPARARWLGMATAAAAIAALAILFLRSSEPASPLHEKGLTTAQRPAVKLDVLRLEGHTPVPLRRGSSVEQGSAVVFRIVVPQPVCLRLLRTGAASEILVDRPLCLDSGEHALVDGTTALAYRAEVTGPMAFVLEPVDRNGAIDRSIDGATFELEVRAAASVPQR